ncbi:MAG: DUF5010 domain-containing protein [Bacteroidota bacterium]|nr:DUF5010 domain-containing protein [Bacteroidota bacterium]
MIKSMLHLIKLQISILLLCLSYAGSAQISTNNWYVGNTAAGEWIKFKKVWLSSGTYRFTTRSVAKGKNQTIHLELNGQVIQEKVLVPSNPLDTFELVHLGHKQLAAGYYDVKLVFETGSVNCDMIFIRKDNNTSNAVLSHDIAYSINRNDSMLVAPIGGAWGASNYLAKGGDKGDDAIWTDNNNQPYTRKQVLSWNKQQVYVYTPDVSDQALDMYVSEQVEAKVSFIFSHGRGEVDSIHNIEDRLYMPGIGGFGCKQLKRLVDAINRNPYAKGNLKIAYFLDNAVFPLACKQYLGKTMSWGDPECQEFLWNYTFKKFYQMIPRDMLFERSPGVVPIQLWSADANYDYTVGDTKILEFLQFIKQKMISTFNLTPSFILDQTFLKRDPRVSAVAEGLQSWFSWGKEVTSMATLNGKNYAFGFNGGRYPLRNVWLADWNPATNEGTHSSSTVDYHFSSLNSNGSPLIRPIFERGLTQKAEWIVLESWFDWREGSTFYRSDHPEYAYPNQYLSLVREFADRNSSSIILEAEACDEFYDRSPGNSGGAYRVNWYKDLDKNIYDANLAIDLDIYRPLHKLSALQSVGTPGTAFNDFSVGFYDIWGYDASGKISCHEADGVPVSWKVIRNPLTKVRKLALSRYNAWALTTDNKVMKCELPSGWDTNNATAWLDVTGTQPMKDLDLNMTTAWGLDDKGNVFYRDLSAKNPWTSVPGNVSSITADDEFLWGFTSSDSIVRMSTQSKTKWDTIPNPYKITKIDAGGCEVWGVNATNDVYRINSSGEGSWQWVANGYTNVSVGYEYVWLSDAKGNMYKYDIKGFENKTSFPSDTSNLLPITTEVRNINEDLALRISPNPFSNYLRIDIPSDKQDEVLLTLFDMSGKLLLKQNSALEAGNNILSLNQVGKLNQGVYLLIITKHQKQRTYKVVKIE